MPDRAGRVGLNERPLVQRLRAGEGEPRRPAPEPAPVQRPVGMRPPIGIAAFQAAAQGTPRVRIQAWLQTPIDGDFKKLADHVGSSWDMEHAFACALFIYLNSVARNRYGDFFNEDGEILVPPADNPERDQYISLANDEALAAIEAERRAYFMNLRLAWEAVPRASMDLVIAHQVRELKDTNIRGYMDGTLGIKGNGSRVRKVLMDMAHTVDSLVQVDDIREVCRDVIWVQYHINASSTPALIKRFESEAPVLYASVTNARERHLVDRAFDAPWRLDRSREIPARVISITGAYHASIGSLPDGWKQFERALAETGNALHRNALAFFRKHHELSSNITAMTAAESLDALQALMPRAMMSPP